MIIFLIIIFIFSCDFHNVNSNIMDYETIIDYKNIDISNPQKAREIIGKTCLDLLNKSFYESNFEKFIDNRLFVDNKYIYIPTAFIISLLCPLRLILQMYNDRLHFKKECKLFLNFNKLNKKLSFNQIINDLENNGKKIGLEYIIDEKDIPQYSLTIKDNLLRSRFIPNKQKNLVSGFCKEFIQIQDIFDTILKFCGIVPNFETEWNFNLKFNNIPNLKYLLGKKGLEEIKTKYKFDPVNKRYESIKNCDFNSYLFYTSFCKPKKNDIEVSLLMNFEYCLESLFYTGFFRRGSKGVQIIANPSFNYENWYRDFFNFYERYRTFCLEKNIDDIKSIVSFVEYKIKEFDKRLCYKLALVSDYQLEILDNITKKLYFDLKNYTKNDYLNLSLEQRAKLHDKEKEKTYEYLFYVLMIFYVLLVILGFLLCALIMYLFK